MPRILLNHDGIRLWSDLGRVLSGVESGSNACSTIGNLACVPKKVVFLGRGVPKDDSIKKSD